MKLFTGIAA